MKKIYYEDWLMDSDTTKPVYVLVNKKKLIKYTQKVLHVSDWRKFWLDEYDYGHVEVMRMKLGDKVKFVDL